MRITCRQYRALLPGYVQRELSPKQRERVSRHLSTCAECYAAYMEQRQIVHELVVSLPHLGAPPRLDKIRAAVMAEMAQPTPNTTKAWLDQARFSLVALILAIALLLPWSMRSYAFALPTPPQPDSATPQGTAVVAVSATEAAETLTATIQSNYAPAPGATDMP